MLEDVARKNDDIIFVADTFFANRLKAGGLDPICLVADEHTKSLDKITDVIIALRERKVSRGTRLVAIGGGVVQDVAAFTASIYMRGLNWVYVPTTLLSMTDSCIGGKSSINVGKYKNIVGTFHPPAEIWIDPSLTLTLTSEQRVAGLCEAAKIALCRGRDCFEAYERLRPGINSDDHELTRVIELALNAKKWFVEVDEFDRGERLVLNFGHTFGHAIEAASNFRISHGVAVGLGMLAGIHLGAALGHAGVTMPHIGRFSDHIRGLLKEVDDLDAAIGDMSIEGLMDAFHSDKKHGRTEFAVISVNDHGVPERFLLPRDEASTTRIANAFRAALSEPNMTLA
jgi:3-dehydroquinate synthase